MEQNKDFQHLMNSITFITIIILVLIIGFIFIKYNPDKIPIFNDEEVVYDTIQVRSNEGLTHELIIKYQIEVSYRKMKNFNKEMFFQNKHEFYKRELLIPVENKIRTVVSNEIRFENLDSIYAISRKMNHVTYEAISKIVFNKYENQNGITVKSFKVIFYFDPVLVKYIE